MYHYSKNGRNASWPHPLYLVWHFGSEASWGLDKNRGWDCGPVTGHAENHSKILSSNTSTAAHSSGPCQALPHSPTLTVRTTPPRSGSAHTSPHTNGLSVELMQAAVWCRHQEHTPGSSKSGFKSQVHYSLILCP